MMSSEMTSSNQSQSSPHHSSSNDSDSIVNEMTIIRSGWIEKKYSHSYKRRYLLLTSSLLFTYLEEIHPEESSSLSLQSDKKLDSSLPVASITDVVLFQDTSLVPTGIGYFEIVIQTTRIRFRCCVDEAALWVRDIKGTIPRSGPVKHSLYQETTSKPKSSSKVTSFLRTLNIASPELPVTYIPPVVFTFEQADALQKFFDFMSSSTEICVGLIISVFESINRLEKSERGKAARQLGHTLAMWLGETSDAKTNVRRASYASFAKRGRPSQMEMLSVWLEISLLREFEESCHFSPLTTFPQARRNLDTVYCSQEKKNGQSNTPLRRDNVESLFLSNFIKGVAVHTGVLSRWLLPSLIRVASDPSNFTPPQKTDPEPDDSSEPQSTDSPSRCQEKLDEECESIFETMKKSDVALPPSLMLLLSTIRKLTIPPASVDDGTSSSLCSSNHEIFYASSCAALFLRLICPAVISPLEWGALRRGPAQQQPTNTVNQEAKSTEGSGRREAARSSMFARSFSRSDAHFNTCHKPRTSFIPSLLKREESTATFLPPDDLTEEEIKRINAIDKNPAVAAVILVAHLLSTSHGAELQLNETSRDQFISLVSDVVRLVPLQKLEIYIQRYEETAKSIVDPSTQKAFESSQTKKALLSFARAIQRIANLSTLNEEKVQHHAIETLIRQTIAGGDRSRVQDCDGQPIEWTYEMLTDHERNEVDRQILASQKVRTIYESIAESSPPVTINLTTT